MNIISAFKAYFTVKSTANQIVKEARMNTASGKPGYKTTEFWMNVAAQIGVLWGAVHGFIPQPWASIISISGVAVYTIAATVRKAVCDIEAAKTQSVTPSVTASVATSVLPPG